MFTRNAKSPYTFGSPEVFPQNSHGLSNGPSVVRKDLNPAPATQADNFAKLQACPVSAERAELVSRWGQVQIDIAAFLTVNRAARLIQLEEQHNAAVAAARTADDEHRTAIQAEGAWQAHWADLDSKAKQAGAKLGSAQHDLKNADRALKTRAELKAFEAHIESLREKAEKAQSIEGQAFTKYQDAYRAREEAAQKLHAAVSRATGLSREIDSL